MDIIDRPMDKPHLKPVNFGLTAQDYARHRADFPPSFFARLKTHNIALPTQHILDLGAGTGAIARPLAKLGCQVTALDLSPEMIAQARLIQARFIPPLPNLRFDVAPAENTGLPSNSFDVITAGQCWHWFDRPAASAEAWRLLKPGGRLVIAHLDWIPRPQNIVSKSLEAVHATHPERATNLTAWKSRGLYGRWFDAVLDQGFTQPETFSYDIDLQYTLEDWCGRMRASAAIGATLSPKKVAAFNETLQNSLATYFRDGVAAIPHRVFAMILTRPKEALSPTLTPPPGPSPGPFSSILRPKSIVDSNSIPPKHSNRPGYTYQRKSLSRAAEGQQLGCSIYDLAPGSSAFPYHQHLGNEEAIYILSGRGHLRLESGEHPVSAGDYIALCAGKSSAHELKNTSAAPLKYLCVSTMHQPDVVLFRDSKKVGIYAGSAPGGDREERIFTGIYDETKRLDYWEGEKPR